MDLQEQVTIGMAWHIIYMVSSCVRRCKILVGVMRAHACSSLNSNTVRVHSLPTVEPLLVRSRGEKARD